MWHFQLLKESLFNKKHTFFSRKVLSLYKLAKKIQITEIENLRKDLCKNKTKLKIHDYGAGKRFEIYKKQIRKLTVAQIYRTTATPPRWGNFLYLLIKEFDKHNVLELGTGLGISGAYILYGLKSSKSGFLTTIEGDKSIAEYAHKILNRISPNFRVENQLFDEFIEHIPYDEKYDFLYIDGNHSREATIKYFRALKKYLTEKAIIFFDDINWSLGMFRAWQTVRIECSEFITFFDSGICLL